MMPMTASDTVAPQADRGTSERRSRRRRMRPGRSNSPPESFGGCQRSTLLKSVWIFSSMISLAGALQSAPQRSSSISSQTLRGRAVLFPYRKSTTRRRMVLTTPESIIEQASTQNLLDDLIDESVRTSARRPIMMQFDPSSGWIWKRWKGTVFSETWDSCVSKMVYAVAVYFLCRQYPQIKTWLTGFNVLWGQLLSVTTFTLTFFVNQSYALWRKCYELSRRLQGRLHDLDMTLAAHAARKPSAGPNEPSTYTAGSRQILELVSRWVRLFNLLTYGSFTRSHRPILTPRGMRRLVERGLMTPQEREVLADAEVPATQRHNAVLLWIIRAFIEGREAGHFHGGSGFENQFLEKIHVTRAQYGAIGDELQGRMPLAYAHIVQVLVDLVLWMYPFMAISSGMSAPVCVLGTGLLTVSYQGLFDLAKQFLDPYDNESYGKGEDPLVVDTLIAETNAGSLRWMYGLEEMPIPSQRFKDAELSEFLLPVRGYSVEELDQMEEEQIKKEVDLQEKRERDEAERLKTEEEDERIRLASEAMIEAQMNTTSVDTRTVGATYSVANGDDTANVPGFTGSFRSTVASGQGVSDVLGKVSSFVGGLPDSLIPDQTAMAPPEVDEVVHSSGINGDAETLIETDEDEFEFVGEDMGADIPDSEDEDSDDDEFDMAEDWEGGEGYVHSYDAFDPYKDLPWHDEVGNDGQEVRLSQLMADDVWEEELQAQQDKEALRIRTYEDYVKKVDAIREAAQSEYLETQDILMAPLAGRDFEEPTSVKEDEDFVPDYDQTRLDSISQLWGLPPDDLSELPGYEEPTIPPEEDSFGGISQLWGDTQAELSPESLSDPVSPESPSFSGFSQLWGDTIDDDGPDDSVVTTISQMGVERDGDSPAWRTDSTMDGTETRLSQMLADEEWEEEYEPVAAEPVTFEDYKQQVVGILEAEQEELLETAAILNAPPGADMLDLPEKEEESTLLSASNSTDASDELAALEMDAPLEDELVNLGQDDFAEVSDSEFLSTDDEATEDAGTSGDVDSSTTDDGNDPNAPIETKGEEATPEDETDGPIEPTPKS